VTTGGGGGVTGGGGGVTGGGVTGGVGVTGGGVGGVGVVPPPQPASEQARTPAIAAMKSPSKLRKSNLTGGPRISEVDAVTVGKAS
jgi:hypothetical protein